MGSDLLFKILNDVARWGKPLIEIVPVNYGELFLRKDWLWILETISQKLPHTQIVLPTNGKLVTEDVARQLCSIPTLKIINFSINAYFDETYKAFMGLPPETMTQIKDMMLLIKLLRKDLFLVASMVFDPAYISDLQRDLFYTYWKEYALPQILPAASAGRGTPIKIPRVIPCRSIFSDFVVGYDGKLSSCCFDPNFSAYDLGYYSGDLLRDWRSEQFQEFRRLHNEGKRQKIPLCRECTFE